LSVRCTKCFKEVKIDITDIWKAKRITKQIAEYLVNKHEYKFTHHCGGNKKGRFEFLDIVGE